jgi:hypothetical protein
MPYPSHIIDTHEISAVFDDHQEFIYLGQWKELIVGNLRLVRNEDDTIDVEEICEEFASL